MLDGFADFTHTQYEILELLAARTSRLLISLPLENESRRQDLFAKSMVARQVLESRLPGTIRCIACERDERADSRTQICEALFANPREIKPSEAGDQIQVLAVAGQRNEMEVLAVEVKQLLLKGVPPEEIALVFRS
ncbi:MAG TPA: hypothetical protein DDZ90_17525, partial [Planctomycetaceae bacterium]|nr:hypothetical protein [Planctomycetaceae bacterium]